MERSTLRHAGRTNALGTEVDPASTVRRPRDPGSRFRHQRGRRSGGVRRGRSRSRATTNAGRPLRCRSSCGNPGADTGRVSMRPTVIFVALFTVSVGCTSTTHGSVLGPGTYRDPAGWEIAVPQGWRAAPFSLQAAAGATQGAQVSNISGLPRPVAEAGLPLQASGNMVSSSGVAVVIATDKGPEQSEGRVFTPPLTSDDLTEGSCLARRTRRMYVQSYMSDRTVRLSRRDGATA